jgi:hypothetical protein
MTFRKGNKYGKRFMGKKPTLRSLKERCWKVFSEYVRRKDADEGGTERCYTCGTPFHWKELHAGHAIPGRHNAVLFDEDIVKPQCPRDNIFGGGMYHIFATNLIKEHGLDWWEAKLAGSKQTVKWTRIDLEEKINFYKDKLRNLPT